MIYKTFLRFDNEVTDTSGNYNKYSGVFTCPTDGVFVFSSSIAMDGRGAFVPYDFVKNADVMGTFFTDAEDTADYQIEYASSTIVIKARQGDVVFIRVGDEFPPSGSVLSSKAARSSFIGWKL